MSMAVHTVLFPIVVTIVASCHSPMAPKDAAPTPIAQDATTVDGAAYTPCEMACERYRQLGCPEYSEVGKDESGRQHTCVEACDNAAVNGVDIAGPVSCTSSAPTCDAVRKCSGG